MEIYAQRNKVIIITFSSAFFPVHFYAAGILYTGTGLDALHLRQRRSKKSLLFASCFGTGYFFVRIYIIALSILQNCFISGYMHKYVIVSLDCLPTSCLRSVFLSANDFINYRYFLTRIPKIAFANQSFESKATIVCTFYFLPRNTEDKQLCCVIKLQKQLSKCHFYATQFISYVFFLSS